MHDMTQCLYCGARGDSEDHVPPRCFLEKPYPKNLTTVRACIACNRRFSMDEEYAVALLAQIGTNDALVSKVQEGGIVDRAFMRRPAFEQRFIDRLQVGNQGRVFIEPEAQRLKTVLTKVVCGLYWLRYKKRLHPDSLGPIGFWPINIENHAPAPAFLAAYSERFQPKRWTIVQKSIFEYMFANLRDGRLSCIINWHNTLWVTCVVPRPGRSRSLRLPGQVNLMFRI